MLVRRQHHAIVALRRLRRKISFAHVGEHLFGRPRIRIAVAAAAGRIEPENIAGLERIIGVARRQAPGLLALRIDPDVAGPARIATGSTVRRDDVLHRADRKAGVGEVEVFAPDAEAAAEPSGAAGIANKLEADDAGRKFALDDFDWRDSGIALVDGDGGGAV